MQHYWPLKSKLFLNALLCILLAPVFCLAREYPDLDGVLDFSKPESISNRLFILTNPKSGSHLLLYSLIKITQRPLRGRVPFWHFENDPAFFPPENLTDYPLNFSKPTTYWGHEYHLLKPLNHSKNKLIFILRNYKENILSQLTFKHKDESIPLDLETLLLNEILKEGIIFQEYMTRLRLFDSWNPEDKCLIAFEDLTAHPEIFVPQVMFFIEDDSEYLSFVDHYEEFQKELLAEYSKKGNRTGSGTDLSFFSRKISLALLEQVDEYVRQHYPDLWEKYLERFGEAG